MSVERLCQKIRRMKNPTVLHLQPCIDTLVPELCMQEGSFLNAYARFCIEIMEAVQSVIPAVRIGFSDFALYGSEGLVVLGRLLENARQLGFYTLLDVPEALTAEAAQQHAQLLLNEGSLWPCDGLILSSYIGIDGLSPFAKRLSDTGKSLFLAVRTGNRSASNIQDILSCSRHVFEAMTELIERLEPERHCVHYGNMGILGPAGNTSILKMLREKNPKRFILADGLDEPGACFKNCAAAADCYGLGVAAITSSAVLEAWKLQKDMDKSYAQCALDSAVRIQKNFARNITIL